MDCNLPVRPYLPKIRDRRNRPKPTIDMSSRAKTVLLTPEEEDILAGYIVELQKIVLRLTINDVINLANQLVKKHNKKLMFRNNTVMAERLWVTNLIKRNPKIILRMPVKNQSSTEFNLAELEYFYNSLGDVYDNKKISPDRTYNTDYIRIFIGKNSSYILNRTGNKERVNSEGIIINVKVCFSADGNYMPFMMIFPQNHRLNLMNDDLQGVWTVFTDTITLTNELFLQWFRKFVYFSGAKKEQQVLLLFDGKPAYTKNIEIVKMTRENGVNIISFPPSTKSRLQPSDEIFISDLSKTYDELVEAWIQSNPEKSITIKYVAEFFGKALSEAAAAIAAVEGFKRCGIYPLDTNMFKESDFVPAVSTKVPIDEPKFLLPTNTIQESFRTPNKYSFDLYYNPRPGCSFWPD